MSAQRGRRDRVVRLGQLAAEQEEQARAAWHEADRRVAEADRRRADALQGAADLADHDLPLAFRAHLAGAGARHLVRLAEDRVGLAVEADQARHRLQGAVTRVRSLDRLVERLDRAAAEERQRRGAAELQDLVASRAAANRAAVNRAAVDRAAVDRTPAGRARPEPVSGAEARTSSEAMA